MRILLLLLLNCCFTFFTAKSQVAGCNDKAALNYNPKASINNGSCIYAPLSVTPTLKFVLPPMLLENSGMIFWKNLLWHHNDSGGDAAIYGMDTLNNTIKRRVTIKNAFNIDWEDIAQDDTHIYVGDFGNNSNGARPNFKIYKIAKKDITDTTGNISLTAGIIKFNYDDQPAKPVSVPANTTNWDCEAMIVYKDKLYLFTKQWKGNKTVLYELSKNTGEQVARRKDSLDVGGLITGADIQLQNSRVVLTGYNSSGQRFIYLLYGYKENNFLGGNKRKIILNGPSQLESVTFINEKYIFLGSESFSIVKQRLETLNLEEFFK
jgi:hypothetical protein